MRTVDVWVYRDTAWTQNDLTGFNVEAIDGSIGKVDETSNDLGAEYVVVDTGPWIFGKRVMLPAGVVRDVDLDSETIFVNRTKDEIKNAPEFDKDYYQDESYRTSVGGTTAPAEPATATTTTVSRSSAVRGRGRGLPSPAAPRKVDAEL